jgi:CheY-like chemotaxis protein
MITQGVAAAIWFPEAGWAPYPGPLRLAAGNQGLDPKLGRPIHVLMIEDDPAIAEMYRLQLEHDGYVVSIATTGEVAQSLLAADAPDLVLLDLLLPDRSGFELLASLNEGLPSHPPVVILSNYGEPSMMDRGRSLGAIEYLVKSRVTPADISRQIPTWIEQGHGGEPPDS